MFRTSTLCAATFALALAAAPPAGAGELNLRHVPADAAWFAHLDMDAARSSKVMGVFFEECLSKLPIDPAGRRPTEPWTMMSIDEIDGMTLFGSRIGAHHGGAVVRGKWDQDQLLKQLKDGAEVKEGMHREKTVYSWTERLPNGADHDVALGFPEPGLMVFTSGTELLEAAIDVIDGLAPSLADKPSPLTAGLAKGAVLTARAANLDDAQVGDRFAVFRMVEGFDYSAREADGRWTERLSVTADSEEVAARLLRAFDGFMAMVELTFLGQGDLQRILQEAELHRAGREVRFSYSGPVEEVVRAIPPACEAVGKHWEERVRMFDQMRGRDSAGTPDGRPDR